MGLQDAVDESRRKSHRMTKTLLNQLTLYAPLFSASNPCQTLGPNPKSFCPAVGDVAEAKGLKRNPRTFKQGAEPQAVSRHLVDPRTRFFTKTKGLWFMDGGRYGSRSGLGKRVEG